MVLGGCVISLFVLVDDVDVFVGGDE